MATATNKQVHAQAGKKTRVETTYEYVPIIGMILGYWRKCNVNRCGDDVILQIADNLTEFDRVIVNGREIEWTYKK